jgi:hypothetical protein
MTPESHEQRHRPVVTIAALYGASGSVIGPRVAERLDLAENTPPARPGRRRPGSLEGARSPPHEIGDRRRL